MKEELRSSKSFFVDLNGVELTWFSKKIAPHAVIRMDEPSE